MSEQGTCFEDVKVVLLQAYGAEVQYGAAIKEKSVRALFDLLDDDGDGLLSPLQVRGVWGRGPGVEGEVEGEGGGGRCSATRRS